MPVPYYAPSYPYTDWLPPSPLNQARVWNNWITVTNGSVTSNTLNIPDWGCAAPPTGSANTIWYNWVATNAVGSDQSAYVDTGLPTATQQVIWAGWATASTTMPSTATPPLPRIVREPTPEEVEAAERTRVEMARRRAAREQEQREASARARALLLAHLSPQQEEEYERSTAFHVRSRSGRTYRVQRGWSGNVLEVTEVDGRQVDVARYCIHPRELVPYEDNMLAQKLLLEGDAEDEALFHKIANRTPLRHTG